MRILLRAIRFGIVTAVVSAPVAINADQKTKPRHVSPESIYPYGIPISGHPGFVRSPYAPNAGWINISGFPKGREVMDPFTHKIFLSP